MKRFLRLSIVLITAFLRAPSAQALTVYLLSDSNGLTTFDSDNPAIAPPVPTPISGLGAFDLVGIDVRTTVQTLSPANPGVGSLWAMGIQGTDAQFFVINPATHVATPVGPVIPGIEGVDGPNAWYFAHDPGRDRFRLINFTNNYELNPNTMSVVKQADLVGFHNVNGSAFETVSYGQNAKMFFLSFSGSQRQPAYFKQYRQRWEQSDWCARHRRLSRRSRIGHIPRHHALGGHTRPPYPFPLHRQSVYGGG